MENVVPFIRDKNDRAWFLKTERRLQRAIYRAMQTLPREKLDSEKMFRVTYRICLHAERLGWIVLPS